MDPPARVSNSRLFSDHFSTFYYQSRTRIVEFWWISPLPCLVTFLPFWQPFSLHTRLCEGSQGWAWLQVSPSWPAQTKQHGQSSRATLLQDDRAVVPLLLELTVFWQGGTELSQEQAPWISRGAVCRSRIRTTPAYQNETSSQDWPRLFLTKTKSFIVENIVFDLPL